MARTFWLVAILMATGAVFAGSAGAAPKGDSSGALGVLDPASASVIGTDDDLFATTVDTAGTTTNSGVTQFGPYPSQTTDSGTCGVDWANDTVDRYFMIQQVGPLTYRVIEKYKDGTFTTFGPVPSPGACDSSDGTGPGFVNAGVTGTFHGYDMIAVTSGTYTPGNANCPLPCDSTNTFLFSVFGAAGPATRDDYAFFFHYLSNDPLVYHEWKNASCNRGGNHGDIQSAPGVAAEFAACP
jgi:hypothetical protein